MQNYLVYFIIALLIVVLVLLVFKARNLNRQIKVFKAIRESDILKTNELFIEKSENELKLFFQFETVLEEQLKMTRKNEKLLLDCIKALQEIRLIVDYQFKK